MSDDDLYTYVVDPNRRQEMDARYMQAVATNPPDYRTFITRATEAGLDRVAQSLEDLQEQGVAIGGAADAIRNIDPEFAVMLADAVYNGGIENLPGTPGAKGDRLEEAGPTQSLVETLITRPEGQPAHLGLEELTAALEYAYIGGAASSQGLAIPDIARIVEIRQAGIDRAQALQAYGTFATQRSLLEGQIARLNQGRRSFTQSDFEEAVFLSNADESDLLQRAAAREAAFSRSQGNAGFSTGRSGRLVQAGFRRPFT